MGKMVFFSGDKRFRYRIVILLFFMLWFNRQSLAQKGYMKSENFQISMRHCRLPILTDSKLNPVISIKVAGAVGHALQAFEIVLGPSTNVDDLDSIGMYVSGHDSSWRSASRLTIQKADSRSVLLSPAYVCREIDTTYFWLSVMPKQGIDLSSTLTIEISAIMIDGQKLDYDQSSFFKIPHRYGAVVREQGQDGIHTSRIPGLATSSRGTLLAIFDARHDSSRDLQGDIDIGLRRSVDGGKSWLPTQIIMDRGSWGGLPQKYNGISDACILVNGDDIYVAALWMYGVLDKHGNWIKGLTEQGTEWNHQWRNRGSQPGFDPKQTAQFMIVKSSDDGQSWSPLVNLTRMCKKKEWWLWAPAPGRGIVMTDGTLVFPSQGRDAKGMPFSNITYSKDGGKTWQTSNPASHNTTECAVTEVRRGTLMLNIRDNRNRLDKSATNGRAVMTTKDMGQTWQVHATNHGALPEPTCMASLFKHNYEQNNIVKSFLLFSNPNSKYARKNITIKASDDGGMTWPMGKWVFLDEGTGSGYSCLTSINDHTIGIVYESSRANLVFQAINVNNFLNDE